LTFLFSRVSYWCDLMFYYRRSTRILRLHGWMVYWFQCRTGKPCSLHMQIHTTQYSFHMSSM
jgi:hypothetical protein